MHRKRTRVFHVRLALVLAAACLLAWGRISFPRAADCDASQEAQLCAQCCGSDAKGAHASATGQAHTDAGSGDACLAKCGGSIRKVEVLPCPSFECAISCPGGGGGGGGGGGLQTRDGAHEQAMGDFGGGAGCDAEEACSGILKSVGIDDGEKPRGGGRGSAAGKSGVKAGSAEEGPLQKLCVETLGRCKKGMPKMKSGSDKAAMADSEIDRLGNEVKAKCAGLPPDGKASPELCAAALLMAMQGCCPGFDPSKGSCGKTACQYLASFGLEPIEAPAKGAIRSARQPGSKLATRSLRQPGAKLATGSAQERYALHEGKAVKVKTDGDKMSAQEYRKDFERRWAGKDAEAANELTPEEYAKALEKIQVPEEGSESAEQARLEARAGRLRAAFSPDQTSLAAVALAHPEMNAKRVKETDKAFLGNLAAASSQDPAKALAAAKALYRSESTLAGIRTLGEDYQEKIALDLLAPGRTRSWEALRGSARKLGVAGSTLSELESKAVALGIPPDAVLTALSRTCKEKSGRSCPEAEKLLASLNPDSEAARHLKAAFEKATGPALMAAALVAKPDFNRKDARDLSLALKEAFERIEKATDEQALSLGRRLARSPAFAAVLSNEAFEALSKTGSGLDFLAAKVLRVPEKALRATQLPRAQSWEELEGRLGEMGLDGKAAKKIIESGKDPRKELSPASVQEAAAMLLLDSALTKGAARTGGPLEEALLRSVAGLDPRRENLKAAIAGRLAQSFEEALKAFPDLDPESLAAMNLDCASARRTEEKSESCALFYEALGQPQPKALPKRKSPLELQLEAALNSCYGQKSAQCGGYAIDLAGGAVTRSVKNEDGTTTQEIIEPDKTMRVAVLDAENRLVSLTAYDKDGKPISETSAAYSWDGTSTRATRDLVNGGLTTEEYDSDGRLTSSSSRDKEGRLVSKMECRPAPPRLDPLGRGGESAGEVGELAEELQRMALLLRSLGPVAEPGCTQTAYNPDGSWSLAHLRSDFSPKGYASYDRDGTLLAETTLSSDKDANLVLTTKNADGSSVKEFRDKQGRPRRYTTYGKDAKAVSETELLYGLEGEVSIRSRDLIAGTTTIENRNKDGKPTAVSYFDKNGKRLARTVFTYQPDGGVTTLTKNADKTSSIERRDKAGKTTEYAVFGPDGKEQYSMTFAEGPAGEPLVTTAYPDQTTLVEIRKKDGSPAKRVMSKNGKEQYTMTFEEGMDGGMLITTAYPDKTSVVERRDKDGKTTQYAVFGPDGKEQYSTTFAEGPNGEPLVTTTYPDQTTLVEIRKKDGSPAKRVVSKDGTEQYAMTFDEGPDGETLVTTTYPDETSVVERRDKDGGIIERIAYGKNGDPLPPEESAARAHESPPGGPPPGLGAPPGGGGDLAALQPFPGNVPPAKDAFLREEELGFEPDKPGAASPGKVVYAPPKEKLPPTVDFVLKAPPAPKQQAAEEAFGQGSPKPRGGRDPEETWRSLIEHYKKENLGEFMALVDRAIVGVNGYQTFEWLVASDFRNLAAIDLAYTRRGSVLIDPARTKAELDAQWTRTATFSKGERWAMEGVAKFTFSKGPAGWRLVGMEGELPFPASNKEGTITIDAGQGRISNQKGKSLNPPFLVRKGVLSAPPKKEGP